MARLKIYQVDAFSSGVFGGNPAAVCPLSEWLPEVLMQKIAAENNLSETAFFVPEKDGFHIRWFTPTTEVELCGHATLASAHVLFAHEGYTKDEIIFHCQVGQLKVTRHNGLIAMDFPATKMNVSEISKLLTEALGKAPLEYYTAGMFGMAVYATEDEITALKPKFPLVERLDSSILIVTAKGNQCDFVSRVFAPKVGIDEDPVTGSAHTRLIPFWSERLMKKELSAVQVSERIGHLYCEDRGDRVSISGQAVTYLIGEIMV